MADDRVRQMALPLPHRIDQAAGRYFVGPCNAEPWGWVERWPDWPSQALALVGPTGAGKSHLLAIWAARSGAALLTGPQALTPDAVPALLGDAPALALDDADGICGDPAREQALLHIFNLLRQRQGWLMLAAPAAPAQWPMRLRDLASRLHTAIVARVEAPDDATLRAVLEKLFADRQLAPDDAVYRFLLPRIERSFASLGALVARLDQAALAARAPISVPFVRAVLEPPATLPYG